MHDTDTLLEWPALFAHLLAGCVTPYGRSAWEAQPFLHTPLDDTLDDTGADPVSAVTTHLGEVDALARLMAQAGEPTLHAPVPEIRPALTRVGKGAVLSAPEAGQILQCLKSTRQWLTFVRQHLGEGSTEAMGAWFHDLKPPLDVLAFLETQVTPEGDIQESASPELGRLRRQLGTQQERLHQTFQNYLARPETARALQETVITQRDGRYVLPVKVEYKTSVPGIVHGSSASGSTLFVEPNAAVASNNALQQTQAALQQEIQKILQALSVFLQAHAESLLLFLDGIGALDRRWAAARLSRKMGATTPRVLAPQQRRVDLKQMRHPLLVLQEKQPVVANNITLGYETASDAKPVQTLVITGPNTGGKTVLLKTLGLCVRMLWAGLPLPVEAGSQCSLLSPVLVDIGDAQDLTQNLSTFSAHLARLRHFVDKDTDLRHGLVLIDEIAAGTDPVEGAALACAVLDTLYQKGALTVVTTHLGVLKLEAHHHEGYENASMIFDTETLSPTYRLLMGVPGSSNALTIAERLGLPAELIKKARHHLGSEVRDTATLTLDLEEKRLQMDEELNRARAERIAAEEAHRQVAQERQQMRDQKRQVIQQYRLSLKGRLHDLETQVKHLKKEIRQDVLDAEKNKITKVKTHNQWLKQIGKAVDTEMTEAERPLSEAETREHRLQQPKDSFQVGQTVRSQKLNVTGTVLDLDETSQTVTLQAGLLRTTLPVSDLRPVSAGEIPRSETPRPPRRAPKAQAASLPKDAPLTAVRECDLRGLRVDEALQVAQHFLDDALGAGLEVVGIIHGHGTGALKQVIRDYLASASYVKEFRPAEAYDGGDGKTIVVL